MTKFGEKTVNKIAATVASMFSFGIKFPSTAQKASPSAKAEDGSAIEGGTSLHHDDSAKLSGNSSKILNMEDCDLGSSEA